MKDKRFLLYIVAFLGCIPLVLCVPYILNAWRTSPMDHRDFIFAIAFVVSALVALVFTEHSAPVFQKQILLADICFLCGFVFCRVISLNSGAIICAIMFWWSHIWMLCGNRLAFNLLPSFMILLLSVVSSVYWMSVFLGITPAIAFWVKIFAMVILLVFESLIWHYAWLPKMDIVVFCMAMTAATAVMLMIGNITKTYAPCKVSFQPVAGKYIGMEMDKDKSFERFFKYSDAHHYKYSTVSANFTLLTVDCHHDIHEIHPASHCLRSSGWTIESEKPIQITIDEKKLNVTEVKASWGKSKILLWVWYSNDNVSTGNFICFRRLWRKSEIWSSYQLGIMDSKDLDESRSQLKDILSTIMIK